MGLQIVSPGNQIKTTRFAHTGATTSKEPVVVNSRVYIPLNTAGANVANEFAYEAEVKGAAKATGEAWAVGQAIYWSTANSNFTTTASGNTLCGNSLETAPAGDAVTPRFQFNSFRTSP
jgi:predicted RecA/RadA family phage recombinase